MSFGDDAMRALSAAFVAASVSESTDDKGLALFAVGMRTKPFLFSVSFRWSAVTSDGEGTKLRVCAAISAAQTTLRWPGIMLFAALILA